MNWRGIMGCGAGVAIIALAVAVGARVPGTAAEPATAPPSTAEKPPRTDASAPSAAAATGAHAPTKKEVFSGKVVLLPEALERRGIKSYSEMKDQVVLETDAGELIPIVADWRGRAFYQDERLRNRRVDLVGTRRPGVPYLQVLMVFTFDEKGVRQYTDYWCDICAIPMYEIKPCDCCQAEIRLRFQPQGLPDFVTRAARADEDKETRKPGDRERGAQ